LLIGDGLFVAFFRGRHQFTLCADVLKKFPYILPYRTVRHKLDQQLTVTLTCTGPASIPVALA
jgi:hypothetical protein